MKNTRFTRSLLLPPSLFSLSLSRSLSHCRLALFSEENRRLFLSSFHLRAVEVGKYSKRRFYYEFGAERASRRRPPLISDFEAFNRIQFAVIANG